MIGSSSASTAAGLLQHPTLPAGYVPTSVVQGDFNGDGNMDLAISNGGDGTVYVLLGKGEDSFQIPEVLYTSGTSPVWIATASLRNNGYLDLIVADGDSNQVETFLGKGDGTFQPGTLTTLTQTPTYLVAGDFNNDGNADVAVGFSIAPGTQGPQFQVLLGDGSGNLVTVISPPAVDNGGGEYPLVTSTLAIGDLNNDGFLDAVTTVSFVAATSYLSQKGTSFSPSSNFAPMDGVIAVALGDMNEDGCLDAVQTGAYGFVTIAPGTCDGNFALASFTALAGDWDAAVAVADVDGDGHLDVVGSGAFYDLAAGPGEGSVGGYLTSVMKGDGKGDLAPATVYPAGTDVFSIAIADLNGDSKPEIVTAVSGENKATLFLNDGSGNFNAPQGLSIGYLSGITNAPVQSGVVEAADLNADGKADLVLIEYGHEGNLPSQITSLLSEGGGKFSQPVRSTISVGPDSPYPVFTTGDFRGTGHPDLIYAFQYQLPSAAVFFPGNGDGSFGAPVTLGPLPNPYALTTGDFNKDGKLDFAVYGYSDNNQTGSEVDVFLGNGDGTFHQLAAQSFPLLSADMPEQLISGDFNHDGTLDLLIGYNENDGFASGDDLEVALGNGDGTFQTTETLMSHFGPVAVVDLNGDGYLDLVQSRDPAHYFDSNDNTQYIPNALTVYLGGPGLTFQQQPTYSLPGSLDSGEAPALVGDFNGDGIPDVASVYLPSTIGQPWKRQLQMLQGVGDGSFQFAGQPYALSAYEQPIVGGDFRGVGLTDLVNVVQYTPSVNTLPAAPADPLSIAFDSLPLVGAQGTATVTLALPSSTGETVSLVSSDPAVQLPPTLGFNAGVRQQSFAFTIDSGFDMTHLLAITATLSGKSATAYAAKVNPASSPSVLATIGGETVLGGNQVSLASGETAQLVLDLKSVDGASGILQNFVCTGLPPGASCTFALQSVALNGGGFSQVGFVLAVPSSLEGGTYSVQVGSSDGSTSIVAPLALSIGGFSLSANPATIVVGTLNPLSTIVTATFTGGFIENIALTCSGLPVPITCSTQGEIGPPVTGSTQNSETVSLSAPTGLLLQDYPFQIIGTAQGSSAHSIPAVLRITGFSGSISPPSATLTNGQSAVFTVSLTSVNHFVASSVAVSCQTVANVTCSSNQVPSLSDNGSATVALTVTYGSTTAADLTHHELLAKRVLLWAWLVAFPFSGALRRRRKILWIVITFVGMLSIGACGGGRNVVSSGGGGTTNSNPPGTTQMISVPIVGNASETGGTVQQSFGTIVLTVPLP